MSFKDKIMNMVISHPKLVTLGIGLAITFAVAPIHHTSGLFNDAFAIRCPDCSQ